MVFIVYFGLDDLDALPQPEELEATEGETVSGP
jgi:hypothetical protein